MDIATLPLFCLSLMWKVTTHHYTPFEVVIFIIIKNSNSHLLE